MRDTITVFADFIRGLIGDRTTTLSDLDRAIAAAASAHGSARRALAVAVAQQDREMERCRAINVKLADLEDRAVHAIRAGRDDLAALASETIAGLRSETEASAKAAPRFAANVANARGEVTAQRHRLAELDRGRRLASIGRALDAAAPNAVLDRFAEAEQLLARLTASNADARAIREEMTPSTDRLAEQMASEGFGPPLSISAADVMARLRTIAAKPQLIDVAPAT